jgi:antitoxin component YwqK of YwqJK toxin-antitoxin module
LRSRSITHSIRTGLPVFLALVTVVTGGCEPAPGEHFHTSVEQVGSWATIRYVVDGSCDAAGKFTGTRWTWYRFRKANNRTHFRVQRFLDGHLHGLTKKVYPDLVAIRSYRNGWLHGTFALFTRTWRLLDKRVYRERDRRWTRQSWFEDGTPRLSVVHSGDAVDGPYISWWPNGELQQIVHFSLGAKHGPASWWYDNGRLQMSGSYKNNREDGAFWTWDRHGVPRERRSYCDGAPCGEWLRFDDAGRSTPMTREEMVPFPGNESTPRSDSKAKNGSYARRTGQITCDTLWEEV